LNAEPTERGGGGGFGVRGGRPQVFVGTNLKIAADERTNSLIVIADEANHKTVRELVEAIDVEVKEKK
jgi:hypothetical protein